MLADNPATIDLDNNTTVHIKVTAVTSGYTFVTGHVAMNTTNVPTAARVATQELTTKAIQSLRAFSADNVTFPSVPTGSAITGLIIWFDSGDGGTTASGTASTLIAFIDLTSTPVTPNGGNIQVVWAGSPNFIFKF
jgi:hypothetical protein